MTYKKIFLITIFELIFVSILFGQNIPLSSESDWHYFATNIDCHLNSNTDRIKSEKFPVITVKITYTGKNPFVIKWDNNFGRVLWNGDIILKSKFNTIEKSSSELKFQTSDTYETQKSLTIKTGDTITSTLDFSSLPGSYLKDLFHSSGTVQLQLYVKDIDKNKLIPIGTYLQIIVD